ncbi:hypothetical protein B0O80DRAFT_488381 [Mortierella sp. GBAus27b]|nr:hypothetical protein B0O80DRAFT_488381 [Mortierella sp. GBAus27b]
MGSCRGRVAVAVERHTNHSQSLRPSRSLASSFLPSFASPARQPSLVPRSSHECTPSRGHPSGGAFRAYNRPSLETQSALSPEPGPLPCNHRLCFSTATTSLSRTPATTSSLPRHIPRALPNRTIQSIIASAQPDTPVKVQGWVDLSAKACHAFWKSTTDRVSRRFGPFLVMAKEKDW